ncbi:hypothetical protein CYMTET_19062 [Cymbomonas tetramitiformis]|uniref:Uncharacterized protein n=1 Tax=Cymbomonas tetramitiformis TaxID=36881 RepID=A0AAE0L594_9CHLO|nr:hypothetical protein CYMTET_19062 [Cymbomonas tetramitiformis]
MWHYSVFLTLVASEYLGYANCAYLFFFDPPPSHRFSLPASERGLDVALRFGVQDFVLGSDGTVCFSIHRSTRTSKEHLYGRACFDSVQTIRANKLPAGSYRVAGVLVDEQDNELPDLTAQVEFEVVQVKPVEEFRAKYEWQAVETGQQIPGGMEVSLPLDGSTKKMARIPPTWRLQIPLGKVAIIFRTDVRCSTTINQVTEATMQFVITRYHKKQVIMPANTCLIFVDSTRSRKLSPHDTVEDTDWFNRGHDIRAGLQRCGSPDDDLRITWDTTLLEKEL